MRGYNHKEFEEKWQDKWEEVDLYKTSEDSDKEKYYILDMFPYPSGAGLHVGHPKGYIATDIYSRMMKMKGYNVLHPMGWDAFGLPAENYAIKNKVHPRVAVEKNVAYFKSQLRKLGFNYDWSREINTTDPEYYKWTQWIFLKLLEKGLAYESHEPINWCPSCQTGLANEDLENGVCERCGSEIERKPMRQWVLKITDYADRLLEDIGKLDWPEEIKKMQEYWIGRKEGIEVTYEVEGIDHEITVFTTRPDTNFGATFIVIAPEHPLLEHIVLEEFKEGVEKYQSEAKKKSELERTELQKDKTGVFTGVYAINELNGYRMPIYVADYVLTNFGTGAVVGVPGHDKRDFEFAEKYDLEIVRVVVGMDGDDTEITTIDQVQDSYGKMINSGFLDGMDVKEATKAIMDYMEKEGFGKRTINYRLQDWVFSRQRYWGEPIPVIHCEECGVVPVPVEDLPVVLPDVEQYEPTGTGESPLATIDDWVNTSCPKCDGKAKRETNTMPQWAGSSWYYLRYIDPQNDNDLIDKDKDKQWSPVDFYVGGAEHATRHLIYARFWHKFLFDEGVVNYDEPFTKLQHVGLIMAEDGRKMSKRWGNVINPDDVVAEYGADAMRVYSMFMGPFSQSNSWNTKGVVGVRKFLDKVWQIGSKLSDETSTDNALLHKTIHKVEEDIKGFKFNTAISQLMILVNKMYESDSVSREDYQKLLIILAPFAPYITEELWSKVGEDFSVYDQTWPSYDETKLIDDVVDIAIQVNGKLRATIQVEVDVTEEVVKEKALAEQNVAKFIDGQEIKRVIYIPGRILNIVI